MTTEPRATVVIAEESPWIPGLEFGAALRRRGYRVVRILADGPDAPSRHRRARKALDGLVDLVVENAVNPDGSLTQYAQDLLDREQPVDWQAAERIAGWLAAEGHSQRLGFQRAAALPEPACYDKLVVTRFLERAGVPVPKTWDGIDDVPADAPYPLMLKGRVGAGGDSVYLCRDREELQQHVDTWKHETDYFVQQAWLGGLADVAGVARDGEIVVAGCYRRELNPDRPLDPSYGIRAVDDPELMEATEALVRALKITGPFALDAVHDDEGHPLLIDVNYRVWGSWAAMQSAGLDIIGAYEYALGLTESPGQNNYQVGRLVSTLRIPPLDVETASQRASWSSAQWREIARRRRFLGPRWASFTAMRVANWALTGGRGAEGDDT